jgi:hypothetical protein
MTETSATPGEAVQRAGGGSLRAPVAIFELIVACRRGPPIKAKTMVEDERELAKFAAIGPPGTPVTLGQGISTPSFGAALAVTPFAGRWSRRLPYPFLRAIVSRQVASDRTLSTGRPRSNRRPDRRCPA